MTEGAKTQLMIYLHLDGEWGPAKPGKLFFKYLCLYCFAGCIDKYIRITLD